MSAGQPPWRRQADIAMFCLGLGSAAWEIFYDQSQNWYVYALIIALLQVGQNLAEFLVDKTHPK